MTYPTKTLKFDWPLFIVEIPLIPLDERPWADDGTFTDQWTDELMDFCGLDPFSYYKKVTKHRICEWNEVPYSTPLNKLPKSDVKLIGKYTYDDQADIEECQHGICLGIALSLFWYNHVDPFEMALDWGWIDQKAIRRFYRSDDWKRLKPIWDTLK